MKIRISTQVRQDYLSVMEGFNETLFKKLNPPLPPVKILHFGGCRKGDEVSLELNFLAFKQKWISRIIEDHIDDNVFYFIDEGIKLPFFLKYWRHKHSIAANSKGSVITDDLTFKTTAKSLDYLLYPALLGQFIYRKPVYKMWFR